MRGEPYSTSEERPRRFEPRINAGSRIAPTRASTRPRAAVSFEWPGVLADRRRSEDARELDWVRQIAAGSGIAFEALFRLYEGRLCRYLERLIGDKAIAQELALEVLVEVWRRAARFRGDSKVSTWIFGIAHHKAIDELRRHRPEAVGLESLGELADTSPSPEAQAAGRELADRLRRSIRALPPSQRAVVDLTVFEGLSCQEVAARLGCPVSTVKTRMFGARRHLRALLVAGGSTRASR